MKNKHDCDGYCYGNNTNLPKGHPDRKEMCPLVDICPETCTKEGIGCAIAVIIIMGSIIMFCVFLLILAWLISA